jgi:hypothetical protein
MQPVAKTTAILIGNPTFNRPRNGEHHLLDQLFGIRVLKPAPQGEPVNNRLV